MSAKVEYADGSMIHIHSMVDPESECLFFRDLTIWGDVLILEGTGIGYHLTEALKMLRRPVTIVLLEYYSKCAEISSQQIRKLCNIDPLVITSETLKCGKLLKNIILSGKSIQIIKHPSSYIVNRSFYDNLLDQIILPKKHSTSKKTTALMNSRFFLQQEICNAVKRSSDSCITFDYEKLKSVVEYEKVLQECIQNENPDMFISVNMLGFDGNGIFSEYCRRYGIPVAVWFVDDPRPMLLCQKKFITDEMTAFCWERDFIQTLLDAGFSRVYHLPLAADPQMFSAHPADTKPVIPLAFAGTSMAGTFRNNLRNKFLWKQEIEPLVFEIAEILLESPSTNIQPLISQISGKRNSTFPFKDQRNSVWLQSYIIHTAGMLKRKRTIESLKNHSIELFGDKDGWAELLGDGYTIHPPVDYATQLCDVYHRAAININITSCQMTTAVNQRVFDVPVSGNFLITDFQKDIEELFDNDEVVTYSCLKELNELCTWYIMNERSRKIIVNKARAKILKQHTYTHRYHTIREMMQ
ncbi:MAG TPA: glycosyltransferase [Chitinispirillaceae bacterium]|nr:glycosyltransferase [Chitinispirillaceae bacterium]